ncbi:YetF domain-containing protein [Clostridium weizhouense]|uniref:DUF421 domain-containing protein n=1 Tax=Clostridium weizhouense TaxID=2859781 RepID=A0ABS7AT56_9CLOT|nr:DUF421 domain-containing protein [Clostridium weizhouense]MBW6410655.1 DUF421 domain-containing protein [Clostridium weizhouense]
MNLNNGNIFNSLFKTTLIFIVLLFLTRILGKKQMSHLTFFNYVTGITIGSIAANMINDTNTDFLNDFLSLIWWCILTIFFGYIGLKSGTLRSILDAEPTILIKKGKIIKKALKSNHLNMDDLSMLLRKKDIFSFLEVDYAILEPNGNLSVLKKQSQQHIIRKDMNIPTSNINYIPSEIIVDGKIIKHNLLELNLTEEKLKQQLKDYNVNSIEDVFYAEIQSDGTFFIDKI